MPRKTPDRSQPNWGYPYSSQRLVHKFVHSPVGHSRLTGSGIVASRWRRHRQNPIGQDFSFTDAMDLPGNMRKPGEGRHRVQRRKWFNKLKARLSRRPVAWVVIDTDECPVPTAHTAPLQNKDGSWRIAPIKGRVLAPVYKDYEAKAMITMDGYEETQTGKL
jgi:hypothetical protein